MPGRNSGPAADSLAYEGRGAGQPTTRPTSLPMLRLPSQQAAIGASHRRCEASGLAPSVTPEFCGPQLGAWRVAVEQSDRLRHNAIPIMGMLYQQITRSESMVVLTNEAGMIIETVGDDDFLESAQKVALANGVTWSESAKGTNAIGTAIVDDAPTLVHGDQHYLKVNHFLTCSASPIHGPDGTIVGVLDVTGDQRSYHQHTMALVNMSTTMIENNLVRTSLLGGLRITLHRRPEFLSTLAEAIACTDGNGMVVAANKVAREEFGLGCAGQPVYLADIFSDLRFGQLVDLASSDGYQPVRLHLADGTAVFARIECHHAIARSTTPVVRVKRTGTTEPGAAPAAPDDGAVSAARGLERTAGFNDMLAQLNTGDAKLAAQLSRLRPALDRRLPILISGASGTGKLTLAHAIYKSARVAHWHRVCCVDSSTAGVEASGMVTALGEQLATIAETLDAQPGDHAVLLDKVDEISPEGQGVLLAWLDKAREGVVAGEAGEGRLRLISTAHTDLGERVAGGHFRADLYYRLATLSIDLPRLADRSDLVVIAARVLRSIDAEASLSASAVRALLEHRWPGNIRELENVLVCASMLAGPRATVTSDHLPTSLTASAPQAAPGVVADSARDLKSVTDTVIHRVLAEHDGNISRAARHLGVSRNTVYRFLRRQEHKSRS